MEKQGTHNSESVGSIPTSATIKPKRIFIMKIKVSYFEYTAGIGVELVEKEVNVIESSMTVLYARMHDSTQYVHLGDLILRSESIQKIEKL